jgi:hypothetical protein
VIATPFAAQRSCPFCLRTFTVSQWRALPIVDRGPIGGAAIQIRRCRCGAKLVRELPTEPPS